jgi:hypothetical protein
MSVPSHGHSHREIRITLVGSWSKQFLMIDSPVLDISRGRVAGVVCGPDQCRAATVFAGS